MILISRNDRSLLGQWWWTVDRTCLTTLILLACFGAAISLTASPPVATRLGLYDLHFAQQHIVLVPLAIITMIAISMTPKNMLKILCTVGLFFAFLLLIAVLLYGTEIKGATRWLSFMGISIQPSEFAKPMFAVASAWLFTYHSKKRHPVYQGELRQGEGGAYSFFLYIAVVFPVALQPDIGQALLISAIWFVQLFLAGLNLAWVILLAVCGVVLMGVAYMTIPHVRDRIDIFLDAEATDSYQITKSLESIEAGGVFGQGPGEGNVKFNLPDAHADFVFAVISEEFGIFIAGVLILIYMFVVLRGVIRVLAEKDMFVVLAVSGLLTQFGLQAYINMATTVNLIPTKGMTLPFISYGGSSLLATAIGMGCVLAFTRMAKGEKS